MVPNPRPIGCTVWTSFNIARVARALEWQQMETAMDTAELHKQVDNACNHISKLEADSITLFGKEMTRVGECEADWTALRGHQVLVIEAV